MHKCVQVTLVNGRFEKYLMMIDKYSLLTIIYQRTVKSGDIVAAKFGLHHILYAYSLMAQVLIKIAGSFCICDFHLPQIFFQLHLYN